MSVVKNEVSTLSGKSSDWKEIPGLTENDCMNLNTICTTDYSSYGRGINGIRRFLTELGSSNGYTYEVEWIRYEPKQNAESYLVISHKKK